MSPPPRSLTFVVSTSLLTASLSLVGCDEQPANPGPVKGSADKTDKGGDEDIVNEGPVTPPPEPPPVISVNEGPEPVPPELPEPVIKHANPGPELVPEAQPVINEPPGPIEPKRVNTQPEP